MLAFRIAQCGRPVCTFHLWHDYHGECDLNGASPKGFTKGASPKALHQEVGASKPPPPPCERSPPRLRCASRGRMKKRRARWQAKGRPFAGRDFTPPWFALAVAACGL